ENRIQRLLEEHEAARHVEAAVGSGPAFDDTAMNLVAQVRAWRARRDELQRLTTARQDALSLATMLQARHDELEKHVKDEADEREALSARAADLAASSQGAQDVNGRADRAQTATTLRHFSDDQKAMSDIDRRIQDEQDLAAVYGNWIALVQGHQRVALHGAMR